jgi:toxin ParE1/3/4
MGRPRKELAPELRSFAVGNHIILYRAIEKGVEIVRVLPGARELPPTFEI